MQILNTEKKKHKKIFNGDKKDLQIAEKVFDSFERKK